ncbi:MAG: sugar phosphate isomerase/epimerase [Planctomycetes bacterium]|nr:sugar phosphate isomerase/epimerase [Planctomycetota bacterium]
MRNEMDRRTFVKVFGAATAGAAGLLAGHTAWCGEAAATPHAQKLGWSVACQLYTFRRFAFYEAIGKIASLGVRYVEPCFFLRLDAKRPQLKTNSDLSPDLRKEMKQRLDDLGLRMIHFYARLGTDAAAAKKTFEFAKEMGAQTIVAEPPPEAFDLIERLCGEYQINLAVHNHPRRPKSRYWRPQNVLAVCEGRSRRIGACCDTGHWVRSGLDPIECLKAMKGRIITCHLKDVAESGNPKSRDVPLGQGKGNLSAVLGELHRQGFRGVLTIEYEHDSPRLMDDVRQCIAFVEKTAASLAG